MTTEGGSIVSIPSVSGAPPIPMNGIYRLVSAVWAVYALGLSMSVYGSQLLAYADPGRYVVTTLAVLTTIGMIVRLIVPGRPQWTRWTLPVIGAVGVASFVLVQFGTEYMGGHTWARTGYSLLVLMPALIAYVHWIAERLVLRP